MRPIPLPITSARHWTNAAGAADVGADTILIAAPVRLIWRARLRRAQKIRIMTVFAASVVTSVASLVHAYFILHDDQVVEALAAVIMVRPTPSARSTFDSLQASGQNSVSLIVANLNVLIALASRIAAEDPGAVSAPSLWTSGWAPPSHMRFRSYRDPADSARGLTPPGVARISLAPEDLEGGRMAVVHVKHVAFESSGGFGGSELDSMVGKGKGLDSSDRERAFQHGEV